MNDAGIEFLVALGIAATPLLLAAIGEWVVERAGIVNVAIEGAMIVGCLAAFVAANATGDATAGAIAAVCAGACVTLVLAALVVGLGVDAIVAGTALNLAAFGLVALIFRAQIERGVATTVEALPVFALPLVAATLAIVAGVVLARTRVGLELRACGENARAAAWLGVRVRPLRVGALAFGGACAGLAGAELVLVEARTFVEGMTGGRGFLALAIVVCGRWRGGGVVTAALAFSAAIALQFHFQAGGSTLPYPVFLALPYVLTLIVLAASSRRARPPADLNRPLDPRT